MPEQPESSIPDPSQTQAQGHRGRRSYRIVQKPAKAGTISHQQARKAARWVKQHRTLTQGR